MDTAPSQSDSREELPRQPVRASRASGKKHDFVEAPSPIFEVDVKAGKMAAKRKSGREPSDKLSSLQETLESLSLQENARDSTVVVPNKKARQDAVTHGGEGQQHVSQKGEVDTVKKKKRSVAKSLCYPTFLTSLSLGNWDARLLMKTWPRFSWVPHKTRSPCAEASGTEHEHLNSSIRTNPALPECISHLLLQYGYE